MQSCSHLLFSSSGNDFGRNIQNNNKYVHGMIVNDNLAGKRNIENMINGCKSIKAIKIHLNYFVNVNENTNNELISLLQFIESNVCLKYVMLIGPAQDPWITQNDPWTQLIPRIALAVGMNPAIRFLRLKRMIIEPKTMASFLSSNVRSLELHQVPFVAKNNNIPSDQELRSVFSTNKKLRSLEIAAYPKYTEYEDKLIRALAEQTTLRKVTLVGDLLEGSTLALCDLIKNGKSPLQCINFQFMDWQEDGSRLFVPIVESLQLNSKISKLEFDDCRWDNESCSSFLKLFEAKQVSRTLSLGYDCILDTTDKNFFNQLFASQGLTKIDLRLDDSVIIQSKALSVFRKLVDSMCTESTKIESLLLPALWWKHLEYFIEKLPKMKRLQRLYVEIDKYCIPLIDKLMDGLYRNGSLTHINVHSNFLTLAEYKRIQVLVERNQSVPRLLSMKPWIDPNEMHISLWPRLIHTSLGGHGITVAFHALINLGKFAGGSDKQSFKTNTDARPHDKITPRWLMYPSRRLRYSIHRIVNTCSRVVRSKQKGETK